MAFFFFPSLRNLSPDGARGLGFGMSLSAYVRAWARARVCVCESGCGCVSVSVCACLLVQHRVQVEEGFEANWDLSRSSSSKRGWGEQAADY